MNTSRALSLQAFLTLLLIALMMSGNHIAARLAFNSGMDVATGVASRSGVTAIVLGVIIWWAKVPWRFNRRQARALLFIGLNIGVQSQMLYAAVARLPVALALLAFNTYPLWATLWDRLIYKRRPERSVLLAMPVILLGLALALDVLGAASGLGARDQWALIGEGVAFAVAGAASFGLVRSGPNTKPQAWTVGCAPASQCSWRARSRWPPWPGTAVHTGRKAPPVGLVW
jgi:drug/metabolite transporter (DMT)-like permease